MRDGRRSNPGRSPRLDQQQQARLLEALNASPLQGGLWSGPKVATWIQEQTGHKTPKQLGWTYLKRLGARLRVPRRKHAKAASPDEQEAWEQALGERVATLRAEAAEQGLEREVEVWAQVESRLGLKPILRRVWTLPGARPLALSWHRYEWFYVYAFVQPTSGRTEWFILPIVLPACTPELQPAERLWPLLNEQIANVAMQTPDELEQRLVARCRQLIEQRELISGLTNFHWWPKAA